MFKPRTFAGRVITKGGKETANDFQQPERFFNELRSFIQVVDEVPLSAVEDLEKYELNRELVVELIRKSLRILNKANLNILEEMDRMEKANNPFDGLEADLEQQKKKRAYLHITGDIENK